MRRAEQGCCVYHKWAAPNFSGGKRHAATTFEQDLSPRMRGAKKIKVELAGGIQGRGEPLPAHSNLLVDLPIGCAHSDETLPVEAMFHSTTLPESYHLPS